jgi:hypothetical protein
MTSSKDVLTELPSHVRISKREAYHLGGQLKFGGTKMDGREVVAVYGKATCCRARKAGSIILTNSRYD